MCRKELILRRCAAANAHFGRIYELNAPKPTVAGDCNGSGFGLSDTFSHPHQVLLNLRNFFPIQKRQQIPNRGIADQKLQPCCAAHQIE